MYIPFNLNYLLVVSKSKQTPEQPLLNPMATVSDHEPLESLRNEFKVNYKNQNCLLLKDQLDHGLQGKNCSEGGG